MKKLMFLLLILSSCTGEVKQDYIPKVLDKETELIFNFNIESKDDGCFVYGETNLPDSIKLGIDLLHNGNTFAQNFDVYVLNGRFKGDFGVSLGKVDAIELSIVDNQFWQSKTLRNQLKFVKSNKWVTTDFGREIIFKNILKEPEKVVTALEIIKPPINYKPIGKLIGNIRDVSGPNANRYTASIDFKEEITGVLLENEIRYWMSYVLEKNKNAGAILIQCFTPKSKTCFQNGYFAPNGEWFRAANTDNYKDFKVRINIF